MNETSLEPMHIARNSLARFCLFESHKNQIFRIKSQLRNESKQVAVQEKLVANCKIHVLDTAQYTFL